MNYDNIIWYFIFWLGFGFIVSLIFQSGTGIIF